MFHQNGFPKLTSHSLYKCSNQFTFGSIQNQNEYFLLRPVVTKLPIISKTMSVTVESCVGRTIAYISYFSINVNDKEPVSKLVEGSKMNL